MDRNVYLLGSDNSDIIDAVKEIRRLNSESVSPITLNLFITIEELGNSPAVKILAQTLREIFAPVRIILHTNT